jgi:hypothetical protein
VAPDKQDTTADAPGQNRTIWIGDGLVLEAHPDGCYILLRREEEPGAANARFNGVGSLTDTLHSMATTRAPGWLAGRSQAENHPRRSRDFTSSPAGEHYTVSGWARSAIRKTSSRYYDLIRSHVAAQST